MLCRTECGACCISPSISSAIPGMPFGKPAGVRCVQLTVNNACALFGQSERPDICSRLRPEISMCASDRPGALLALAALEIATLPTLNIRII